MIDVTLVPILNDNYAYLLEGDGEIGIVDPGEATPILEALKTRGLSLDTVFITHYHGDHIAGLDEIAAAYPDVKIMGAKHDHASSFAFAGEEVEVIETPGHKRDHVCFHFPKSQFVLSGDTLFAMGCGRVLDGTAEELYASLQKLAALPDETRVYCGHEYTLSNAKFCASVAPDDAAIMERYSEVQALRDEGKPTIPSTIGAEKASNVFLHAKSAAEFAALRTKKDSF